MPTIFQHLLKFPLLQNLPQAQLFFLSARIEERTLARREVAMSREQTRYSLGLLLEGRLQGVDFTVDGRGVGLYFVEPGDYFGELSVIDNQPASEHVIATTKSTVLLLPAEQARSLIVETPALALAGMTRLAGRLRELQAQRTLLALPNPFQRLCAQLLSQARPDTAGGLAVDPAPTHQELAMMINASRETVTRAFQILILKEVVKRDGNCLRLVKPGWLGDVSEGRVEPPKA